MTDIKERLLSWCIDWNGAPMVDGEQPRIIPRVRDLRDASDKIGRLEAALRQAVAYADIVARSEGMPAGKQAKRLTATATSLDGSGPFETAEFDVAAARAALSSEERQK